MKYAVEFEMNSESSDNFYKTVYEKLISAFGRIENLTIVPRRTYFGYIRQGQSLYWHEVGSDEQSDR